MVGQAQAAEGFLDRATVELALGGGVLKRELILCLRTGRALQMPGASNTVECRLPTMPAETSGASEYCRQRGEAIAGRGGSEGCVNIIDARSARGPR